MELAVYILFRIAVFLLELLPLKLRLIFVESLIRLIASVIPRYKKIARKNLQLVFPDESEEWREEIIKKSTTNFARVVVDFLRMPKLDKAWVDENIIYDKWDTLRKIKEGNGDKGVLAVSAHFASFDFLPFWWSMNAGQASFVIREFKHKRINSWWNSNRECSGNITIPRKWAVKRMIRSINEGRDVGILFDQNVIRKFAVFVEWFGKKASTTMGVGIVALRTKVPVLLCLVLPQEDGKYRIESVEFDFRELYEDESISKEEKIKTITRKLTEAFEDYVRKYPEYWFWMHRRWKTTEFESIPEDFYD